MTPPVRVLVADDQALVREGIRAILEAAPGIEVVAEASTGDEAVAAALRHRPDVALLDVQMPMLDGIAAAERILRSGTATRVLMVTTFDTDEYLYDAMRAGASGFLLKSTPREQLIAAVRTVAAGDALVSSSIARRLIERFISSRAGSAVPRAVPASLSPRELEVWRHLARGRSNAEIAHALHLAEATVKSHVANVLAKLGLRDRAQAVIEAYELGLVRPGNPDTLDELAPPHG